LDKPDKIFSIEKHPGEPLAGKRVVVTRVLSSPQLQGALRAITVGLREGGLPVVAAALDVFLAGAVTGFAPVPLWALLCVQFRI